jgi:YidC/Oxa1 family membrane protein insertase
MDNYRLILIFSWVFLLMLLWQAWEIDYGPKPVQAPTQEMASLPSGAAGAVPGADPGADPGAIPAVSTPTGTASPTPTVESAAPAATPIRVKTDLYTLTLSSRGGTVTELFLNDYPVSLKAPETKFQLMRPEPPDLFIAQSGLIGADPAQAPTHEAIFSSDRTSYEMEPGQQELRVELAWESGSGIRVIKSYRFQRGSYLVQMEQRVENRSDAPWTGREYRQLMRTAAGEYSGSSFFLYTYTGAALYSPQEKFQKVSFDDMTSQKLQRDVTDGWIAMIQHYFIGAWVPPRGEQNHFYSNALPDGRYVIGAYGQPVTVASTASHSFASGFVAGPKLQDHLESIAPGLDLTVDYGLLTFISKPIFWLMQWIYDLVGNWGWSIILLTLLIKLAFYKLSETSYRSMAGLKKLTPRLQALKDRYGDDRAKMNEAMMKIYKEEKINPLGGCLPILVQIPVFIALYWVLLESVEMRQAPFILWIDDLSTKDPYFVLPLIMGVSMYIQQKLNPAPPDPMQAKIMMSLPFVFTIFFAFFPSGLVLYWVVNNVLSIAQQWYITKQIEEAGSKAH